MKAIIDGLLVLSHEMVAGQVILYDKQIEAIIPRKEFRAGMVTDLIDAEGFFVSPGFINEHIHGCGGVDVMDEAPRSLEQMSRLLPATGVTAFVPTTMTYDRSRVEKALQHIQQCQGNESGAQILGAHMEGPFINPDYKGAQDSKNIGINDYSWLEPFAKSIKILTVAPETLPGNQLLDYCQKNSIIISVGHSAADYDLAMDVMNEYMPCHVTHLFNAMPGFHHRAPGIIGAAFDNTSARCEIICDNLHVHPAGQRLLYRQKGREGIILITDSMRACLMAEGESELGGQKVFVKDSKCCLADGTIAGSVLTMEQAVLNFIINTQAALPDVIAMATENPAKDLGVFDRMGSLAVGKQADITLFDEAMKIRKTLVQGTIVYNADEEITG